MTNSVNYRARYTDLLDAARRGEKVTAEQLAEAAALADAQDEITQLKEAGEAERAREAAERQRLADQATAAAAARDDLPANLDRLRAAYAALDVILAEITDAHAEREQLVRHHSTALAEAGFATIGRDADEPFYLRNLPHYDEQIVPNTRDCSVLLDGVRYAATSPARGILWAAVRAGHHKEIEAWKRSGSTPLTAPLPELDTDQ